MENAISIAELVLMTGLSDRTVRSYLTLGILQGEKQNGAWRFTAEQVQAFVVHPSVRPSILAKQNGAVYDFLLDSYKQQDCACIILDLPSASEQDISAYFCKAISEGDYHNIRFSFDGLSRVPRVILSGNMDEVMRLANGYRAKVAE